VGVRKVLGLKSDFGYTPSIPGTPCLFQGVQGLLWAKCDFPQVFLSLQNLLYVVYNIGMTSKEIVLKTIRLPELNDDAAKSTDPS
jgi:hypothetical protein